MEVLLSDADKRLVKITLGLLRRKLGEQASRSAIHDDMKFCGNLGIKKVAESVETVTDLVKSQYQHDIARDLTELGLWICYKDTAYRDLFFYLLDDILKNADEIRALIKPYVKPPEKWHVNIWVNSKDLTKQQIEKGELLNGTVSEAESVFVPGIQRKRLSRIANRNIRR